MYVYVVCMCANICTILIFTYIFLHLLFLSLPSLLLLYLTLVVSLSPFFKAYLSQLYKLTDVAFLSSFSFSIAIVDRAFPILATDSRCVSPLEETKSNTARYDPPVCHHRVLNNKISFFLHIFSYRETHAPKERHGKFYRIQNTFLITKIGHALIFSFLASSISFFLHSLSALIDCLNQCHESTITNICLEYK